MLCDWQKVCKDVLECPRKICKHSVTCVVASLRTLLGMLGRSHILTCFCQHSFNHVCQCCKSVSGLWSITTTCLINARSMQFHYWWCQLSNPRRCCNKALLLQTISPFFWCWYLNLDASSILSVWVPCNGVCWQRWLLLDYCLLVDLEVAISISNKPSKRFKMILIKTLSCFQKSQLASNVLAALFMSRLAMQLGAAFTFSALLLHAIMQWDCLQA